MTTTGSSNVAPPKPKKKIGRPKKWIKIPAGPRRDPPPPEEPETHIPGTEEHPWAGATGGEGGFEEALKGAGEEAEKPEGPPPPPGSAPPPPVDPAEIEALINFTDLTTVMVCRAFAMSRRVPWTQALQKECMLNDGEKAQLVMTAPAALPWIRKMMLHMDKLAAAMFFVSYSFMLAGRMSIIKERAPKPEPKKENGRETPVPTPSDRAATAFTPTFGAPASNGGQ